MPGEKSQASGWLSPQMEGMSGIEGAIQVYVALSSLYVRAENPAIPLGAGFIIWQRDPCRSECTDLLLHNEMVQAMPIA